MILLIDNFDSFAHNLARYLRRLGQTVVVHRNNEIGVRDVEQLSPAAVILSPGPCTPAETGCSLEVVRQLGDRIGMLGVCLGHQTIAAAVGAEMVRAAEPVHGRSSEIHHDGCGIFRDLPSPFEAARYHSLVVREESLPPDLRIAARTSDGTIMAIRHRTRHLVGLQFHPESILTQYGYHLLSAFLQDCGLPMPDDLPNETSERVVPASAPLPDVPVTF